MSLILEALKKSEAERRLGQAPDLLTPTPRLGSDDHPRWPLRIAVAVLALGLGAAAAWWFWPRAGAPPAVAVVDADAPADAVAAAGAQVTPAPAAGDAAAPAPATVATPRLDAAPGTPTLTRPAATVPQRAPEAAPPPPPADPGFASVERESQAVPAGELPAGMAPGSGAPSAPPQPPRPLAQPPADADRPVVASPRSPPARTVATPPGRDAADALPTLRELSPAEREALPPLQQSMHVYNDDPARRFVILDGRRLGEGERIDERLLLVEIRRDGVVLELDGRRFLLPRPG